VVIIERGVPAPAHLPRGRPPRYHRDLRPSPRLLGLVLATLLAVGSIWAVHQYAEPGQLSDVKLSGERLLHGDACIAIAADLSGSMTHVAQQRRDATATLLPWLHNNLRPGDQVSLVAFTDTAVLVLPPSSVDRLQTPLSSDPNMATGGTAAVPAITLLGEAFDDRGCSAIELLMITDGKFSDTPADVARALAGANITRTHILNPDGDKRAGPLNDAALGGIRVLPLGDTDQQALTYGRIIADLTGQELTRI
jgi:hypothetical protein